MYVSFFSLLYFLLLFTILLFIYQTRLVIIVIHLPLSLNLILISVLNMRLLNKLTEFIEMSHAMY